MSDILRNLRVLQGVYEKPPQLLPATARMYKEAADALALAIRALEEIANPDLALLADTMRGIARDALQALNQQSKETS